MISSLSKFLLLSLVASFIQYCSAVPHPPLQNVTFAFPVGTNNHSDKHLICTPARTSDLAAFYLANFVAHAATVKTLPGEPLLSNLLAMLLALLFPTSAVLRAIFSIWPMAIFQSSSLKMASSSGALCCVVKLTDGMTTEAETLPIKDEPDINLPQAEAVEEGIVLQDYGNPPEPPSQQAVQRAATSPIQNTIRRTATGLQNVIRRAATSPPQKPIRRQTTSNPFEGVKKLSGEKPWKRLPSLQIFCTPFHEKDGFKPAEGILSFQGRKVHGICKLPEGYGLRLLPTGTVVLERGQEFEHPVGEKKHFTERVKDGFKSFWIGVKSMCSRRKDGLYPECAISCSYSFAKAAIAIFQTVYASFTLYRTRGDQLNRYGYAAFGLTVAPYVVMSFVNLLCGVFSPDYAYVYMVESPTMWEARQRYPNEAIFKGTVGTLQSRGLRSQASSVIEPLASRRGSVRPVSHASISRAPSKTSSYATGDLGHTQGPQEGAAENSHVKVEIKNLAPHMNPKTSLITSEDGQASAANSTRARTSLETDPPKQAETLQVPSRGHDLLEVPSTVLPPAQQDPEQTEAEARREKLKQALGLFFASILVGCFAIAIIGGISGFKAGNSTRAQRIWTMMWLSFGIAIGPVPLLRVAATLKQGTRYYWIVDLLLVIACAPGLGGYYYVGKMLNEYGRCIRIY